MDKLSENSDINPPINEYIELNTFCIVPIILYFEVNNLITLDNIELTIEIELDINSLKEYLELNCLKILFKILNLEVIFLLVLVSILFKLVNNFCVLIFQNFHIKKLF